MKKIVSFIIVFLLILNIAFAVDQIYHSSQNIRFDGDASNNLSMWRNPSVLNLINSEYLSLLGSIPLSAGVIPVLNGGTGIGGVIPYTTGDLIYASSGTMLSKLNIIGSGNVLISGANPSWGKVSDAHISGVNSNKITWNSNINLGDIYEIDAVKRIDFTGGGFMYDDGSKLIIGRS